MALEDGCTLKSITPLLEVTHDPPPPPAPHDSTHAGSSVERSRGHPNHHYLENNGVRLLGLLRLLPPVKKKKEPHRYLISVVGEIRDISGDIFIRI